MQRRTPVFIVTSSRPRGGKTLIARLLTEYFFAQKRPVQGFDVNPDEFKMLDHLPAHTAAASSNDTRGEVELFDQLIQEDIVPKVVDLGHLAFDRFFSVMRHIGFENEIRRRAVAPLVLFLADTDERAQRSYAMLYDRFELLPLVPLFNEYLPQIDRCRALFPTTRVGGDPISIPTLTPVVRSVVDRRHFSFVNYVQKTNDPTSELFAWMRRLFISFREKEVRLLLGDIVPQLQQSA